jgi:hypothetical protein
MGVSVGSGVGLAVGSGVSVGTGVSVGIVVWVAVGGNVLVGAIVGGIGVLVVQALRISPNKISIFSHAATFFIVLVLVHITFYSKF